MERALAIRERVLGPDHPDTANGLNNLAGLLQAQGELDAGPPLFERALAIDEKVLGPDHLDTAGSVNNMAGLLWAQGELTAARALIERAMAIREKVLGPDDPLTAMSSERLAQLTAQAERPAGIGPLQKVLGWLHRRGGWGRGWRGSGGSVVVFTLERFGHLLPKREKDIAAAFDRLLEASAGAA